MSEPNCISIEANVPEIALPTGVPVRASWRDAGVADHFVQFYRDDQALADAVAGFLVSGLRAVEAGLVIGTAAQREAIAARLQTQGIDLESAARRKQYVALDAESTLATFMVDGMPDERLFQRTVGHVITQMLSTGFRVRAFAELAAQLCAQDNFPAALRLEQLWNRLGKSRRFSLFCACPIAQFPDGANDVQFRHVCAAHSSVIPPF